MQKRKYEINLPIIIQFYRILPTNLGNTIFAGKVMPICNKSAIWVNPSGFSYVTDLSYIDRVPSFLLTKDFL